MGIDTGGWIMALVATGLAFGAYYRSKVHHEKEENKEGSLDSL